MSADESKETDLRIATMSARRWTRASRRHLCRSIAVGLVAGLVLVGLASTAQAGPHFVLETLTVTKGGQTYYLSKNASGQWVIPVWPDIGVGTPLLYSFTWRLVKNGGSNFVMSQITLHSDVKLGGVSQGKAEVKGVAEKVGKNLLFNYSQMSFPIGIQLVVNINPPVTSAVDQLVTGPPSAASKPSLKFSVFMVFMNPTFQHARCVNCHGMASQNATFIQHVSQNMFPSNTNVQDATKCASCHGAIAPGWRAPAATMNWTGKLAQPTCQQVKAFMSGSPLVHHLKNDGLIKWAINSGVVPQGKPAKAKAMPGNLPDWNKRVDVWNDKVNQSCVD